MLILILLYFIYNPIILKNTSFFTSLYKLDYIINKKENLNDNIILKKIKAKVLA
jgi:hypothetical protein